MPSADVLAIGTNRHRVLLRVFVSTGNEQKKGDINHLCATHGSSVQGVSILIRKQKTPLRKKGMCMKYVACIGWAETDSTYRGLAGA